MNTCVILPTYNERANIEEVVSRLFTTVPEFKVLVVDDNSPDGTAEVVAALQPRFPRLDLLVRTQERGFGTAYIAGFRRVLALDPDGSVLMMDSDLSHDPVHIPAMLKQIVACDAVVGSRYVEGGGVAGWGRRRQLLSSVGNTYIRMNTRMPFRDCTSGFNLIRTSALQRLDLSRLSSTGYAFLVELKFELWTSGAVIREVPITFHNRVAGESKLSGQIVREAIALPWKLISRKRSGRRK
jgi:dolichol-phosphate mannosyltransferase